MTARADLPATFLPSPADAPPVDWMICAGPVPYPEAVAAMESRVAAIAAGDARECVWLLEHPALYTAGTSTAPGDGAHGALTAPGDGAHGALPVFATGRGGQMTYHGPGQRVAYVLLDLKRRAPDLRRYVAALEHWLVETLAAFAIRGERREDRVGVWIARRDKPGGDDGSPAEDKIAALGIRVRRWVSFHGVSLNVEPDLAHYAGITPCGIGAAHHGVTSLADLGHIVAMSEVDAALRHAFEATFGPTTLVPPDLPVRR